MGQGSSNDFGKVHEVDLGSGRVYADSDVVSSGACAGAGPASAGGYARADLVSRTFMRLLT